MGGPKQGRVTPTLTRLVDRSVEPGMEKKLEIADTAIITLNLVDATRQPLDQGVRLLVTLRDGNQKQVRHDGLRGRNH